MEGNDDPLNKHRRATNETCLQSILLDYPVTIQQSTTVSLMTDTKSEQVAFPVLFPKGRFGYKHERKIKVKYFNARLLHYSGRFATNPEYLFFAQFVMEQKKLLIVLI